MKQVMENFLSCDWGTTAFRLKLIDGAVCKAIAEEQTTQGIAATFKQWKETGKSEEGRLSFYLDIISEHIKTIEKKTGTSLNDVPLIISGMASSTIGMADLPYKDIPFSTDGSDLKLHTIPASVSFKHRVTLISGVRTEDDVMRGEETKLIGCTVGVSNKSNHLFIFPGTHPKHVHVKNDKATAFKTYMTGEFFNLLSTKSILSVSVAEGEGFQKANNVQAFKKGVKDTFASDILHTCFLVRTNNVFNKLTKHENYYYLSGLLIGSELKDVESPTNSNITIVGNEPITQFYITAFDALGLPLIKTQGADEALIKGQLKILRARRI